MNTLQNIMGMMLKRAEENPDKTIEQIVEGMKDKGEINPETYSKIMESFDALNGFDAKSRELADAKENGLTRHDWVTCELEEVSKPLRGDASQFIRKITEGLKNIFNKVTENK